MPNDLYWQPKNPALQGQAFSLPFLRWIQRVSAALNGTALEPVTTTLTNSQILTLPTTGVEVAPAQGDGTLLALVLGVWSGDFAAGAYTNIDGGAWGGFSVSGYDVGAYIVNDPAGTSPMTGVTDFFGTAGRNNAVFSAPQDPDFNGWGAVARVMPASGAALNNQPMIIYVDNNGAGNFTGGAAANSLTVSTTYIVGRVL